MRAIELPTDKKYQMLEYTITMNNQTACELRDIIKEQGIRGNYKLTTADLIALLSKKSTQQIPI